MMYAVIHAPHFRLQSITRYRDELRGRPAILLEGSSGKKACVAESNPAARLLGVEAGMTASQALARCAGLEVLVRRPELEISAQDILLQLGETLSPFLEATENGTVTIQLSPEKNFEISFFKRQIIEPLQRLGLDATVGVAGSPPVALAIAKNSDSVTILKDNASFPLHFRVESLEPSPDLLALLNLWGIHTVCDLLALPRTEACNRLGTEAIKLWDLAKGGNQRPLNLLKPIESFSEQIEFENSIELLEPILLATKKMLEQLSLRLVNFYFVAAHLELTLRFENGTIHERRFLVPMPTRDVRVLFRMLYSYLERFRSESPISGLRLAAIPTRPETKQADIFESGLSDPHRFAETLAQLEAIVGADRVGRVKMEASYRTDAFHLKPYAETPYESSQELCPMGLPLHRFRPPIKVDVCLENNTPISICAPHLTGRLAFVGGPWRTSGEWWDNRSWKREEWDVATERSSFCRIVRIAGDWFLDGVYA